MRALLLTILTAFVVSPVFAQNWTPEEKELVAQIHACWDGWVEARMAGDVSAFENACPLGNYAYWGASSGAPGNIESLRRNWAEESARVKQIYWEDLRPLSIKISGDTGVIHYYGYWFVQDHQGEEDTYESKRMETWQKQDGRWTLIGGIAVPVSD